MSEETKYPINGFAPGDYSCTCRICGEGFLGAKRSWHCEPCALKYDQNQNNQAKKMNKAVFLMMVYDVLMEEPDWFADTVITSQQAILERVKLEADQRSKAETALLLCYEAGKAKIKPPHKLIIENALINSGNFAGTKFAEDLQQELNGKKGEA